MKKKLLLLTTLIFVFLFSISVNADVNEDDQNMVITGMASIDDNAIINKDVYIAPEATVFCDNVTINGDLYVWGSILVDESITVTGTANVLSFAVFKPEMYSEYAPNYDDYEFGELTSFGTADIAVLNISDNYLGMQIPEIEGTNIPSIPTPTAGPSTPAPTPSTTATPTPDTVYVDALVISEDTSYTDATFDENIYIEKGYTLTLAGNTVCNGDIYVFGALDAYDSLTVNGTLNCLHYGSMMHAGNYDYGYFNCYGSCNAISLNIMDNFLNVLPSEKSDVAPEPTATPDPTPTPEIVPTPEPTEEPTPEPTETPTPMPTETPTPEPTIEPEPTPIPTPEPTPSEAPVPEPTATPEVTEPPVPTPVPSSAPEPTPETPAPTPAETDKPAGAPTATEKPEPVPTDEPVKTPVPSASPSVTEKPLPAPTSKPTQTAKPVLKLNVSGTIPMKVKTTFSGIKATKILKGDRIVKWKSSNQRIVNVTQKGKISAKKTGSVTITCTTAKGAKASFRIKVQKSTVKLKKITTNKKSVTLNRTKAGKTFQIVAQKNPLTASGKITYKTANKNIAAVSSKGKITAKKKGKTKIYVICGKKKITINVTVK